MRNLLAIDIGNTNITAGIFKGAKLLNKTKIPTYAYSSYAKRIKALIKVIPRGRMDDIEIIIVDDGSTDDSLKIIKDKYANNNY
jgi:pantothenate kinase type III